MNTKQQYIAAAVAACSIMFFGGFFLGYAVGEPSSEEMAAALQKAMEADRMKAGEQMLENVRSLTADINAENERKQQQIEEFDRKNAGRRELPR